MSSMNEIRWAGSTSLVESDDAGEGKPRPALSSWSGEFCLACSHPPHLSYHVMPQRSLQDSSQLRK